MTFITGYCGLLVVRQAIELDPSFSKNIGQVVLLGGAFAVNGNVNPAAEANVSSPELCPSLY